MIQLMRYLNSKLLGRLKRSTVWGLLLLGTMLTLTLAFYIKSSEDRLEEQKFKAECSSLQGLIDGRLADHARLLMGGAALFETSEMVTREEWRIFTQHLQVDKTLPGIQGFGFALLIPRADLPRHIEEIRQQGFPEYQVRPAGEREMYSSIIYLEPFSGRNLRAFGYDMFSEPVRRSAMERARDTGSAALSGKVTLVQETDKEVQAGTLMYVPVYRNGLPTDTVEQRRAAIFGWVYSPYRMNDLFYGILGESDLTKRGQFYLKVFDGVQHSPSNLLFSTHVDHAGQHSDVRYNRELPIDFNGHRWTLCFTQAEPGILAPLYRGVALAFIGGMLCTLLLGAFFGVLLNTQSEAQRMAGMLTTDLQKSRELLLKATERLSLAVRAGGVGIWEYDVVNNRLVWDDQMFRLYGITPGQFSGAYDAWQAGLHPDDRQRGDDEIQRALRGDKEFDIEFRVVWPDGTVRHIRGFALVLRDVSGRALQMIGTNWDITELKLAEENIRHQASLINSLLDSMPDIIFFKDVEGHYLGCNPRFIEFVGRAKEEIVGKTDDELFGKVVADGFRENDRQMLEMNASRHNEEWITYPDGRKILIDTLKTPYMGPDGERIGILGISRDITASHQVQLALRESEANFRTFFETITDLILVATPEGRILLTNPAYSRALGYTQQEFSGMQVMDLHPAEFHREAEAIFEAMFRGERESCPLPLWSKDGSYVPVETRIWLGQWNGMKCLFGISKNLSAEQEAQKRFERLFRSNPCPIALSSIPDRRFVDVNDAFVTTVGYTREEVIGNTSAALGFFANQEQQAAMSEQLRKEGRLVELEVQLRRKDGTLIDGLIYGEIFNSLGHRYLMTIMVDITARKRSEAELARVSTIQHALMLLATDFVNVPLEQQDLAIQESLETIGKLIHADRAYLFAYDFEQGVMSNTHEWCEEGISPEIANLQSVPIVLTPDWVAAHQRGEEIHIPDVKMLPAESHLRQILEPQGIHSLVTLPLIQGSACLGFVGFDAVREKRIWREEEVALLQVLAELYTHFEARLASEREMRELQKRLTQARDAAQEAAVAKSLFLANMSHEIRTPLNAILGYAQIMGRECLIKACPMSKKLGAITRSGEHLLELLTDLMELVRSEAHETRLSASVFDFYQALEDVRLIFVKHPGAQTLTLEVSHEPEVPRFITSDSGKIRQVLVNLVSNAIKFTEVGGVRVLASVLPDSTTDAILMAVDVEDTGCGIHPEAIPHLFDLFYTHSDGTRKAGKGTGLGLPLSQRYARALGGDIALIRNAPEGGSCFRFTFRTRVADGASVAEQHKGIVSRIAPGQPPFRILVVDDAPDNREMLIDLLEPLGVTVVTAESGTSALQLLSQSTPFDLVLMDKRMPEMDGYETIRRLRTIPGREKIPVLVVTASGAGDEQELAEAAGANGYVSKPVHREKLLEEIGRVTGLTYEYESLQDERPPERPLLNAESFSRLPVELCRMLDQALHRGDIQQLRTLVEAIATDHPKLAEGLRVLVDAYDYDRLRHLLESVKGHHNEA